MITESPIWTASTPGTTIRRARRLKSARGKKSSRASDAAPTAMQSQGTPASHSPQSVGGTAAGCARGSLERRRMLRSVFEVIQSRPEWRSFETPAPKNTKLITSHIIRIGQVYSPFGAGRAARGRRAARTSESTDQPSPQRENARIPIANTRTPLSWWIFPKLWGIPIRYMPSTNAPAVEKRVKSPAALVTSRTFHATDTAARAAGGRTPMPNVRKNDIGSQKTRETLAQAA